MATSKLSKRVEMLEEQAAQDVESELVEVITVSLVDGKPASRSEMLTPDEFRKRYPNEVVPSGIIVKIRERSDEREEQAD